MNKNIFNFKISLILICLLVLTINLLYNNNVYAQNKIKKSKYDQITTNNTKSILNTDNNQSFFDNKIKMDILNINFISKTTDEIEFNRIYKFLLNSFNNFKLSLIKTLQITENNYNLWLNTKQSKYDKEEMIILEKIKNNKDINRKESLNSLLELVKKEHEKYYQLEASKIKNMFKNLFETYLQALEIEKKSLSHNTIYESDTSELMLAITTFEIQLKEKMELIDKYIDNKFKYEGK